MRRGDRRTLARLLTVLENGLPEEVEALAAALHPQAGTARVTGVTGSPGVGKSTLVASIAGELRRRGRSVAILAVDPSSPFSGGAMLGDRVRMQRHDGDEDVFIRSMSNRGHLGGLSLAVPAAVLALDAAGFGEVLIETVGVGQSEIDVAAIADTTIIVLAPGMGDGIQAAKAGILEVADILVINKADHEGAGKLHGQLLGMLDLNPLIASATGVEMRSAWRPPIVRTIAVTDDGVAEAVDAIDAHVRFSAESGEQARRIRERAQRRIRESVLASVSRQLRRFEHRQADYMSALIDDVAERHITPDAAAAQILETLTLPDPKSGTRR